MATLLDQLLGQIAYPPPMPTIPQPEQTLGELYPRGYDYGAAPNQSWDPRALYRMGRQMGADNLGVFTSWLPEGVQNAAMRLYSPPAHAIGWPYPGFTDLAYGTTGIQPATPSPLLNWVLWGHGLTPAQPQTQPWHQWMAPQGPMPPEDPGGWAR